MSRYASGVILNPVLLFKVWLTPTLSFVPPEKIVHPDEEDMALPKVFWATFDELPSKLNPLSIKY